MSRSSKKKEAAEAKGLLNQFRSFDVLFVLTFLDNLLSTINVLSIHLQSSYLDIIKCLNLIDATIKELQRLRSDEFFNNFYKKAQIMVSDLNISMDNYEKRQKNINTLSDYVITSTIGLKCNKTTTQKFRIMYFTVIDNMLSEMKKRFNNNSEFSTAISVFNPISTNFLNDDFVLKCINYYGDDNYFSDQVISQSKLAKNMYSSCKNIIDFYNEICIMGQSFGEIKKVIERVLVIPVSSASAERSFSTMKRIKTYLRTSMSTTRLHNLELISIERELSFELIRVGKWVSLCCTVGYKWVIV
ncbi:unnamed protein product [Macrosiphum euphorbiae]|uniref:HAT C-terminal dimerisation domain-containing protein n=1 Tax=Macrosiphum euphorbiae TaxID=13131 RepID=A0AAV0WRQ9_9HEMI|nr:unnamed protein product [Macrosiphum euphorbiae]